MKKHILLYLLLFMPLLLFALEQRGIVRTIARQNRASEPLSSAIVRVRGSHNAVESGQNGEFTIVLAGKQNGDPFIISNVLLQDYELADKELLGRQLACSDNVPIEILMVSRQELQQEKDRIARKARENVEIYYEQRVAEFENQLKAGQILQEQYQQKLDELEAKYEQFEPLLELMADKYARTDISMLSEIDIKITSAIENGNFDEAEQLIRSKGDFTQREQSIANQDLQNQNLQNQIDQLQQRLQQAASETQKQREELAEDYYRLYTIQLSRFENDSAEYYIVKRAALDTTNIDNLIQAGLFMMNMQAKHQQAKEYFLSAVNQAQPSSLTMAVAEHNLAQAYQEMNDYDKAEALYKHSLKIRQSVSAEKNPEDIAETLNNLAELYWEKQDYKSAINYQQKALKICVEHYGEQHPRVAICRNNLANIYVATRKLQQANEQYTKALQIALSIPSTPKTDLASYYNNLGTVCFYLNDLQQAENNYKQAYSIYQQVFGDNHKATKTAYNNLQVVLQKQKNSNQSK